jgi:hypothetical protein
MSQNTQQDHVSKKRVVYTMPGVDAVTVRRDEEYRVTDADALTMDLSTHLIRRTDRARRL